MPAPTRWTLAVVVAAAAAMFAAGTRPALAQPSGSYTLPAAAVVARVQPDGTLAITEDLSFDFSGSLRGAYRDIRVRPGERVSGVQVSEGATRYRPGASTVLGSTDTPGTFGVEEIQGATRVVWHYRATDQRRTFRVAYTLARATVAYTDVAEVNLQVWGEGWRTQLEHLDATLVLPGQADPAHFRAWGRPREVKARVALGGDRVSLAADGVNPGQAVVLRALFPRALLASTGGARPADQAGFDEIVAAEAAADARAARRERVDRWTGVLAGAGIVAAVLLAIALVVRTRRRLGADAEPPPGWGAPGAIETSPPDATPPALVAALLARSGRARDPQLTATVFDLVRRGHYSAGPSPWPASQGPPDVVLAPTGRPRGDLAPHEQPVAAMLDRVIAGQGGSVALGRLGGALAGDPSPGQAEYAAFKAAVKAEFRATGWTDTLARSALGRAGLVAAGLIALATTVLIVLVAPAFGANRLVVALAGLAAMAAFGLTLVVGAFGFMAPRYTEAGALPAARWRAYRVGLAALGRAGAAPEPAAERAGERDAVRRPEAPSSAAEFDHQLVYAVALGLADVVIAAGWALGDRHPVRTSPLLWYGHGAGYAGAGSPIGSLSSSLGSSLAPPSSSGGGFSGGGISGGSSGGGGGGAW
jgi:hypothetical protein